MSFSLEGRVALVTGSSTGLGKTIAIELVRAGAKVAINYYNHKERADSALAELRESGGEGIAVRADVSDEQGVNQLAQTVRKEFGKIDIVVANATPAQPQLPIEEYTWQHYERMLNFFVKSPYLLTRAVVGEMKQRRWGRIINIGSEVFQRSVPNFSAYVSAKGAQYGFTRSMAVELAPWNITVNLVAPGWVPVERHEDDPQEHKDAYFAGIPMNRWGVPKDVADAVVYYSSEEAGFVTGQTLCVNGGCSPW